MRVLWTVRRSNQSILKEISPKYSLEELMRKLKFQYSGGKEPTHLEKTLMLGKNEGRRRKGRQMVGWHHKLKGRDFEQALGIDNGQRGLGCYSP